MIKTELRSLNKERLDIVLLLTHRLQSAALADWVVLDTSGVGKHLFVVLLVACIDHSAEDSRLADHEPY